MKKQLFYFVVFNFRYQYDNEDDGVCFASRKLATKYRKEAIKEHTALQKCKLEDERVDLEKAIRIIVANSNFGFKVYDNIETDGEDCTGYMPYTSVHQDGGEMLFDGENHPDGYSRVSPNCGEYRDMYVVVDSNNDVTGLFDNYQTAKNYHENHDDSELFCYRNIENGFDLIRWYYYVIDKVTRKAICFSCVKEAKKYLEHTKFIKETVPEFKNSEFIICKVDNSYGHYSEPALTVHNTAEDVMGFEDYRAFQKTDLDVDGFHHGYCKVFNFKSGSFQGVFKTWEEANTYKTRHEEEEKGSRYVILETELKIIDTKGNGKTVTAETKQNIVKAETVEMKTDDGRKLADGMETLRKVMEYASNVGMDEFIKDFQRIFCYVDVEEAKRKYYQLRGFFPVFYLSLEDFEKNNLVVVAMEKEWSEK